jgi:acyl-coenzyme A synthetase/AMP-(fatty) acid ligase
VNPRGAANRLVVDGRATTWSALIDRAGAGSGAGGRVVVLADGHAAAFAAVARHVAAGVETLIAAAARVDEQMRAELRADGFTLVPDEGGAGPVGGAVPGGGAGAGGERGRLWILTSGSTGRAKRVPHTLDSLATVGGEQPERTWLCPYSPGTYAWWQVVTLSLCVPGQHVVTATAGDLDTWPELAARHGVTAVSGTPTFWRQSVWRGGDELGALPLRQVTLGGEPVDQPVLDRLRDTFPRARISWIYASSEVGAAIAVHDGRAGFPVAWLDRDEPGRPRLAVDGGELLVTSSHAADGYRGPVRTGDRVEIVDGRVLITGRRDLDEINVGGTKVSAGMVRAVLLGHDKVRWVRVTGARGPLVGQVVSAEVVADAGVTEADLRAWAAGRLADAAVPRRIRLLDAIPMKETLKSDV